MTITIMKILEKRGYSNHETSLSVDEDHEGVRTLTILGPKGCMIVLPWDDVLHEGMEFLRRINEVEG